MSAGERAKRETEALGVLDAATRVVSGDVEHTVSADEQTEMALALMDWAAARQSEGRAQDAYAFLRAADALPKGPREDPDLVERLCRLAIDLGMDVEAGHYRRRLKSIAPDRLRAIDDERAAGPSRAPERAQDVRYRHAKFGVGTLVRREESGLRLRFDDGERVIVASRLEKM